jgi:hypothetical protein
MIKGSNLEHLPFGRDLTDLILATSSQPERIQVIKERSDQAHLLIMHWYVKRNIQLKIAVRKLRMICHRSLLTTSNAKQFWKSYL